jgi:hypothetical protein
MYFKDLICYWPRTNIQRKVKKLEMPDKENWQRYKVRIFGYAGKFYCDTIVFIVLIYAAVLTLSYFWIL